MAIERKPVLRVERCNLLAMDVVVKHASEITAALTAAGFAPAMTSDGDECAVISLPEREIPALLAMQQSDPVKWGAAFLVSEVAEQNGLAAEVEPTQLPFTQADIDMILGMRDRGYAVVIFSPDELRGVERRDVENRLVELGNEVISCLKPEGDNEVSMTY